MTEEQFLKRKLELKLQGQRLIREEIFELKLKLILLVMKERLESQLDNDFDQTISLKIDCVNVLLDN